MTDNNITLLLIHGFPLSRQMWQPAIMSLRQRTMCRILAPDLRGFGESGLLQISHGNHDDVVTMDDFADDLLKLCHKENAERLVVAGLSMGGYVAMAMANRAEPLLAGIILCDTKATADTASMAAARRELAADLTSGNKTPADLADAMLPRLVSPATLSGTRAGDDALLTEIREVLCSHHPLGLVAAARGMAERRDSTELLASLDLPILALCGEDDALSPPDEMQRLATLLRRGTFTTIPDAGHLAPWESPNLFADAVAEFIERF